MTSDADFYEQLRACLIRWRETRENFSQADAAKLLGISKERYKKLEGRDRFPLVLVENLCRATGWKIEDVVLGRFHRLLPPQVIVPLHGVEIQGKDARRTNVKRTRAK